MRVIIFYYNKKKKNCLLTTDKSQPLKTLHEFLFLVFYSYGFSFKLFITYFSIKKFLREKNVINKNLHNCKLLQILQQIFRYNITC